MLRKSLIAAAVALCSNGTGAAELKVTELGVVETLGQRRIAAVRSRLFADIR